MKTAKFDARFLNELTAQAKTMTQRECEYMAAVGIRKELEGKWTLKNIETLEHIYWVVAASKGFGVAA